MAKSIEWAGKGLQKTVLGLMAISIIVIGAVVIKQNFSTAKPSLLNNYNSKDQGEDRNPDIAYSQNKWIVVWDSDDDLNSGTKQYRNIFFTSSNDGEIWGKPEFLVNDPVLSQGHNIGPSIAADGKNNWAVVWGSSVPNVNNTAIKDDSDLLMARSKDNGLTWMGLRPFNRNAASDSPDYYSGSADKSKAESDTEPRIAANGNYWVVVWEGHSRVIDVKGTDCSDYNEPSQVYMQYADNINAVAGNQWLGPYCEGMSWEDKSPTIAGDGNGNWVLAWSSGGYANYQSGPFNDYDIRSVYANESLWSVADPAVKWSSINDIAPFAGSDNDFDDNPSVATDGQGNWIIVWSSKVPIVTVNGNSTNINSDYDLLLMHSDDNGITWKDLNFLNSNATSDSGDDLKPQIISNGNKEWIAVWQSNENLAGKIGQDFDILISKSNDHGNTWTPPQALHDNADTDSGDDINPRIATDNSKWVVVWQSSEDGGSGTDSDILFASFSYP